MSNFQEMYLPVACRKAPNGTREGDQGRRSPSRAVVVSGCEQYEQCELCMLFFVVEALQ